MLSPKYRLPLLHHTQRPHLPVGALRIFHCFHYLIKHRNPVDLDFSDLPEGRYIYRAPVADFRELVGPRNTNDTRAIRAAVAALEVDARLAAICLSPDRRSIDWSFSREPAALLEADPYLSLDISIIASLGTPLEIYLYEVCRRLDALDFPQQDLLVSDLCFLYGKRPTTWAALKPAFLRAATQVSRLLGIKMLLQIEWRDDPSRPSIIRFRPAGSKSRWSPPNVYKALPSTKQILIEPDGILPLTNAKIAEITKAYQAKRQILTR